jgi:hypothetical protein
MECSNFQLFLSFRCCLLFLIAMLHHSLSLVVALAVVLALCQPTWSLLRVKQDQHNVWFDGDLTHRNVDAHLAQDLSIRVPHPLVSYIRSDDELLLFNYGNVSSSVKIAAFDYDSTLGIPPQWQQLNYTWVPDGQTCKQSDWVLPGTRHIWYVARSLTHSLTHSLTLTLTLSTTERLRL